MIGKEFSSDIARSADTPEGGKITFAIGKLTRDDDAPHEPAIAVKVLDSAGGEVALFALTTGSFGVLLECMQSAFAEVPPEVVA